ncbi:MAG TPA: hypothetical protein VIQ29_20150 [Ancylobacter sp.]
MTVGKHLFILSLATSLLGAPICASTAAMAQATGQSTEPPTTFDRIEKSLSDAATEAMDYISSFIPYKMPEVQPNGDIVIRRDKPAAEAEATPSTPDTTTPDATTPGTGTSPPAPTKI